MSTTNNKKTNKIKDYCVTCGHELKENLKDGRYMLVTALVTIKKDTILEDVANKRFDKIFKIEQVYHISEGSFCSKECGNAEVKQIEEFNNLSNFVNENEMEEEDEEALVN